MIVNWLSVLGIFVLGISPNVYLNPELPATVVEVPFAPGFEEAVGLPGEYDDFAQCLTALQVVKYGSDLCPHCLAQKELFGNSFQYVSYIECNQHPDLCIEAEITAYPTWVFYDFEGTQMSRVQGKQGLEELSLLSGCSLTPIY
jgi:hypothetical protein